MSTPAIRIGNVTKRFGATFAVRDLQAEIPTGCVCGFLGPNGAGKSTTIRMVMSIIYPDAGTIEVLGGRALDHKDRIGYLPEERGVYRKMRVGEFLAYLAQLKGIARAGLSRRVDRWLERLDLGGVSRKRCQELSKGMQQKVQFLAAVVHEPDLLILDEPFSGLDPVNAEILIELIGDLRDEGRTVIFSTHVLHQAEQICDRILLIHRGVKRLDATLEEIRSRFDPRTLEALPLDGAAALDGLEGVRAVAALDHGRGLELHLEEGADPQQIMKEALACTPLRSIRLRRLTVEEVFVQLVRRDEGDAAARRAREALALESGPSAPRR